MEETKYYLVRFKSLADKVISLKINFPKNPSELTVAQRQNALDGITSSDTLLWTNTSDETTDQAVEKHSLQFVETKKTPFDVVTEG